MAKKRYYIGTRKNPQLDKPYYIAYGQLTKKEAYNAMEKQFEEALSEINRLKDGRE